MQWPPTRPGLKRQEVPLGAGRLQDLERIEPHAVEDQGQLVDQRNVDVTLGVLDDLGGLGHADARRRIGAGGDDAAVKGVDELCRLRRRARGDLADGRQSMLLVARIDALGTVADEEILIELESGHLLEDRRAVLLGAARVDRRLVDHDRALAQHLADGPAGGRAAR